MRTIIICLSSFSWTIRTQQENTTGHIQMVQRCWFNAIVSSGTTLSSKPFKVGAMNVRFVAPFITPPCPVLIELDDECLSAGKRVLRQRPSLSKSALASSALRSPVVMVPVRGGGRSHPLHAPRRLLHRDTLATLLGIEVSLCGFGNLGCHLSHIGHP